MLEDKCLVSTKVEHWNVYLNRERERGEGGEEKKKEKNKGKRGGNLFLECAFHFSQQKIRLLHILCYYNNLLQLICYLECSPLLFDA